ncbi:MAG: hypothetical protein BKP49_11065 [Treponema sp. CETP13]|nr:MAG: hypothetical protein BKP49_11065 [Treponema sp. CETP13]
MDNKQKEIPLQLYNNGPGQKTGNFHIKKLEELPLKAYSPKAHRHDFFEIIYITEGEGTHVIDFKSWNIEQGSVFLIHPGQVHYWQTKFVSGYALIFQEESFISSSNSTAHNQSIDLLFLLGQQNTIYLDTQAQLAFEKQLVTIKKEYDSENEYRNILFQAYLNILIVFLSRIKEKKSLIKPEKKDILLKFKKLVIENYKTEKSVSFFADHMCMTVNNLIKTIKSITGFSPGQILRHALSMEARRLLVHTDLTTAQIAYELHFEDPSYFSRFFKRETGQSPSQFRKNFYLTSS